MKNWKIGFGLSEAKGKRKRAPKKSLATKNYEKTCIKQMTHTKDMATCVTVTEQSDFGYFFKHNWVSKLHYHSLGFGKCKSVATKILPHSYWWDWFMLLKFQEFTIFSCWSMKFWLLRYKSCNKQETINPSVCWVLYSFPWFDALCIMICTFPSRLLDVQQAHLPSACSERSPIMPTTKINTH